MVVLGETLKLFRNACFVLVFLFSLRSGGELEWRRENVGGSNDVGVESKGDLNGKCNQKS